MANNPQFAAAPGQPFHPPSMVGAIPPPIPTQFRPVGPVHPSQQFAPPVPQEYRAPPPTQQMQFAQPVQQQQLTRPGPSAHLPPTPESMGLPNNDNIQLNRPISSGMLQPLQNLHNPGGFVTTSGGPGVSLAPSWAAVDLLPKRVVHSSGWIEHTKTGSSSTYYYNKRTKKSTWEKPLELMTPLERADATTDWKEYTSLDGRKYFYNNVTKQSKWIIPEVVKRAREEAENASCTREVDGTSNASVVVSVSDVKTPSNADAKSSTPVFHSSPAAVTPVASGTATPSCPSPQSSSLPPGNAGVQIYAVQVHSPVETSSTFASGNVEPNPLSVEAAALPANEPNTSKTNKSVDVAQGAEEENKDFDVSGNTTSDEKVIESETPTYASKQEAKDAFKELLESANVDTDWTWEQVSRLISSDKRYAALRSVGERKQAFNEFLNQKKKQEAEERRARNKKAREDFKKMLEECSELTSATRWGKILELFGDDERFKAIERGRDREDMFDEYVVELQNQELEKAEEERQMDIKEYRRFLQSCDFITANSQWRRVKDHLEFDERCSRLDTIDQLKIFQEYVGDLEKEEEELRRMQKEELRKSERRNRDVFRKLMEGNIADGTLTAKTSWFDYHSKVKDLPAYQAISSNTSGSTPKELFEDVVEELNKQFEEDRTRIKDAVKSEKVALSSSWTLEELKAAIATEIGSPEVSESSLKLVFDELVERAREREEKEAKRRKRLGDEFFNMLCSLKDMVGDSKWEDCLPLFEGREEFRSVGDDAFAKEIFGEYIEQLKEKEKERDRKRKEEKAKREKEREREKKSKERREKDRRYDRSRGKERNEKDDGDGGSDYNEIYVSNENRKSGKDKDRKHRKRHHDEDDDLSLDKNEKDYSRSSHRHSSERKKSRQMEQHAELSESDDENRHKKHKRDHRNGSRRRCDNDELEDGELDIL